jgi:hypothetical protein
LWPAIASIDRDKAGTAGPHMMKMPQRNDSTPRRPPTPDVAQSWNPEESVDKGRKHEAFDTGFYSGERRGLARALRFDRKR